MGSQYHLEVGGQDFYIDLLFYHHRLRALVVIELKMEEFSPSFVGQQGFYLAVLDDTLKHPQDGPTIGLLLCKSRNRVVVEYSLRGAGSPLAVADYQHPNALPAPEEWENCLRAMTMKTSESASSECVLEVRKRDRLSFRGSGHPAKPGYGDRKISGWRALVSKL